MENFIVREDGLYLNDEPFKLLSGRSIIFGSHVNDGIGPYIT